MRHSGRDRSELTSNSDAPRKVVKHGNGGYVSGCRCEVCSTAHRLYNRAYYLAHEEELKAKRAVYTERNRDRLRRAHLQYDQAHREEKRTYDARPERREDRRLRSRAARAANPEKYREENARWRREHPEVARRWDAEHPGKRAEYSAAYCKRHPEKRAAFTRARRAMIAGVQSEAFSLDDVIARDGTLCAICGLEVDLSLRGRRPGAPSLDHVIPISAGGPHVLANAQLAHMGCNSRKGDGRRGSSAPSAALG